MAKRPITMMIAARLRGGAAVLSTALALAALAAAPGSAATSSSTTPAGVSFVLSAVGSTGSITLHGIRGRVLRGAVTVRNLSRRRITVILQRADIENASNGNADYLTARIYHTGRWLHLGSRRVRLAPHATRQIAFSVRIPAAAAGGSHYAGIVAVNAADLVTHAAGQNPKRPGFTFYRVSREALPLTIRLPGRRSGGLSLRSVKLVVQPIGAGLVLGLRPRGNELTEAAPITLRVLRGARTVFTYASTLGQLFPGSGLSYRIPWPGRPTPGRYHLIGKIRPEGSGVINIDQTIGFSAAKATQLTRETPPLAQAPGAATPGWVWIVLVAGGAVLIGLLLVVYKLARRPRRALA